MGTSSVAAGTEELTRRAAVLSYFDVSWITDDLTGPGLSAVLGFLRASCDRVLDPEGNPRWQLDDDERRRVLRSAPVSELRRALSEASERPTDAVQNMLERHLEGRVPALEALSTAELSGLLQLSRWWGDHAGLPDPDDIQARVEWHDLLDPLQRMLAHGFVGRDEEIKTFRDFVWSKSDPRVLAFRGVGGCGKSTLLARMITEIVSPASPVAYLNFDRGWLIDAGSTALFHEVVRQLALQLPSERTALIQLRHEVLDTSRVSRYYESASRVSQQRQELDPTFVLELARQLAGRRIIVVLDTFEEVERREESFATEVLEFVHIFLEMLPEARIAVAGRSVRAEYGWPIREISDLTEKDAIRLLHRLTRTDGRQEGVTLLHEIVTLVGGNPLSLQLAADVLLRTGDSPATLIAVSDGNVQGQLYARLLDHIRDKRVRAIAHPGLVLRRITPDVIIRILADPCGLGPVDAPTALEIFDRLRAEATLTEPAPERDGSLVHRSDVRALMLPAIRRDSPDRTREIHESAVAYYSPRADRSGPDALIARREELYHRLMLSQDRRVLDSRWHRDVQGDFIAAIDELPVRSQVYLITRVKGLRLTEEVLAEADDEEWSESVAPAVRARMERRQVTDALALLQQRRAPDGTSLLPELEVEALERLARPQEAVALARSARERATRRGNIELVRALLLHEARVLERMSRFDEAWSILAELAALHRHHRAETNRPAASEAASDEERVRDLVVLTSLLRIARHQRREDDVVADLTAETITVVNMTALRILERQTSLLRDLAAELPPDASEAFGLAVKVLGAALPAPSQPDEQPVSDGLDAGTAREDPATPSSAKDEAIVAEQYRGVFTEDSDFSMDYF